MVQSVTVDWEIAKTLINEKLVSLQLQLERAIDWHDCRYLQGKIAQCREWLSLNDMVAKVESARQNEAAPISRRKPPN